MDALFNLSSHVIKVAKPTEGLLHTQLFVLFVFKNISYTPKSLTKNAIAVCYTKLMIVSCRLHSGDIPLGSHEVSIKTFSSRIPYFEGGYLKEGFAFTDSVFRSLKQPTAFDYGVYYTLHSWVDGDAYKRIRYADSFIYLAQKQNLVKELISPLLQCYTHKLLANFELKNCSQAIEVLYQARTLASKYSNACSNKELLYNLALILYGQQVYLQLLGPDGFILYQ